MKKRTLRTIDEKKVVKQYKNWSVRNIAKLNHVGQKRIKEVLIRNGVKLAKSGESWKKHDLRF